MSCLSKFNNLFPNFKQNNNNNNNKFISLVLGVHLDRTYFAETENTVAK